MYTKTWYKGSFAMNVVEFFDSDKLSNKPIAARVRRIYCKIKGGKSA